MFDELISSLRGCHRGEPRKSDCPSCVSHNEDSCSEDLRRRAANAIEELEAIVRKSGKWVNVKDRLPEDNDEEVLVTDGEYCAVGFWREDAKAWDNVNFGWLENLPEGCPTGIKTVTHWMMLPKLPEE